MTSRLAPHQLAGPVRERLSAERDALTSARRPRGNAGLRHDRTLAYLTAMLGRTSVSDDGPQTAAQAGDLVTVRFSGDAEHRTYLLAGADTAAPAALDAPTNLPASWPLGTALLGRCAGDDVTYTPDGTGAPQVVTVLAVWAPGDARWRLPAGESTDTA